MRSLKFRVWDKLKSGWVDYDLEYFQSGKIFEFSLRRLAHCVYQQFTGLLDKNGKEIYEGDLMEGKEGYKDGILKVVFERGRWNLEYINGKPFDDSGECDLSDYSWTEVVGNIFENPELLNESKN